MAYTWTLKTGQKVVTTATTAEALVGSSTIARNVVVSAKLSNTGDAYIGDSTVSAATGFALEPGGQLDLSALYSVNEGVLDLADIWADVTTSGNAVTFTYV